jgi:hypothetical protein
MSIHPAIDPDYPAAIAAMRQLCNGARPSFRANSSGIYQREGYDHLYFRGLALRHSNGETGKYETFTYVATEALLLWAIDQRQQVISFDEALAKIDVKKARAKLYGQRRAERSHLVGVPNLQSVKHQVLIETQSPLFSVNEDGEFSSRGLTDWYVREFEKINGLRKTA